MPATIDLANVRGLNGVLDRLPQGQDARTLVEKMGLWTASVHNTAGVSRGKAFPHEFSRLSESELSNLNAYWLSEVFRITELVGLLEGQRMVLALQAKANRATVRAQLRRKARAAIEEAAKETPPRIVKEPTAAQLSDEVEEDASVIDGDTTLAMLAMVAESAKAYKEACLAATAGISREISFRQAQMGARIR